MRLYKEGFYQYDPTNYHGPTLYYFALAALRLLGLTTFALRLVPALFGVATVGLVLCLRRHLGEFGVLAGSALLAVSPGAVYMSRYFIHESLLAFFTLGVVVATLRYRETGRFIYFILASVAAALAFATKETAIISASVLVLAFFLTPLLMDIRKALSSKKESSGQEPPDDLKSPEGEAPVQNLSGLRGKKIREVVKWSIAALVFVFVLELFYSSFFSNNRWVKDVWSSFQYWARTGRSGHVHSWYTYISWLMKEEVFVLLPGLIGVVAILWRAGNRFLVFTSLWLCGLLCAYSIVPYKTPWIALNFIIPLAILGGYVSGAVRRQVKTDKRRALVAGALSVIFCATLYQMIRLNYIEYDDERHPYVYAHTNRELLLLTDEVSKIANSSGEGLDTAISITSSEYWPLPWYLRDYKHVIYQEQVRELGGSLVIISEDQEGDLQDAVGDRYERVGSYILRSGYNLVLYALRGKGELQ